MILNQKKHNTYPYIYVTKGIHKEDIFAFNEIRLFMGIQKYTSIDNYCENNTLYKCPYCGAVQFKRLICRYCKRKVTE